MSYKFEIVITVWEDGLYRHRNRKIGTQIDLLELEAESAVSEMLIRLKEQEESRYKTAEDDDIPF